MTSKQFRVALKCLGITQRELATRICVTPNTIWRWASGAVEVPRLVEIALEYFRTKKKHPKMCGDTPSGQGGAGKIICGKAKGSDE